MNGSLHVGLAALGAALGCRFDRNESFGRGGTEPRRLDKDISAVNSCDRFCRSDRILRPVLGEVGQPPGR